MLVILLGPLLEYCCSLNATVHYAANIVRGGTPLDERKTLLWLISNTVHDCSGKPNIKGAKVTYITIIVISSNLG